MAGYGWCICNRLEITLLACLFIFFKLQPLCEITCNINLQLFLQHHAFKLQFYWSHLNGIKMAWRFAEAVIRLPVFLQCFQLCPLTLSPSLSLFLRSDFEMPEEIFKSSPLHASSNWPLWLRSVAHWRNLHVHLQLDPNQTVKQCSLFKWLGWKRDKLKLNWKRDFLDKLI